MNRYYGHIYNHEQMLNKNVADFTNFDGKTNKRIVQAPGGASSISLAWSNERPTNEHKNITPNPSRQKNYMEGYYRPLAYQGSDYNYPEYSPKPDHMGGYYGYRNNSIPGPNYNPNPYNMRPTDPYIPPYSPNNRNSNNYNNQIINQQINSINYGIRSPNSHNTNTNDRGYSNNSYGQGYSYGGANGYGSPKSGGYYSMPDYSSNYNSTNENSNKNGNYQQLDLALKQYDRNNKPKSVSLNQSNEYEYKPSIKVIGAPSQQFNIGNPNYNFWTDNDTHQDRRRSNKSEKRVSLHQMSYENNNTEKTSVKVSNPPGGKQSIRLG